MAEKRIVELVGMDTGLVVSMTERNAPTRPFILTQRLGHTANGKSQPAWVDGRQSAW